jgi:hypothetical protein
VNTSRRFSFFPCHGCCCFASCGVVGWPEGSHDRGYGVAALKRKENGEPTPTHTSIAFLSVLPLATKGYRTQVHIGIRTSVGTKHIIYPTEAPTSSPWITSTLHHHLVMRNPFGPSTRDKRISETDGDSNQCRYK